jgi:hypothetical protein
MISVATLTAYPQENLHFTARNDAALPARRYYRPTTAILNPQDCTYALRSSRFTDTSSRKSLPIPACDLLARSPCR